jgi:hypothetical protein
VKTLTPPLMLLASIALAVPAIAGPSKSAAVKVEPVASPFINYTDEAAVKKVLTELGYKVGATEQGGTFQITTIEENEYVMLVGACPDPESCGVGAISARIDVDGKKPTDAWLARMNQQGAVARVIYLADQRQVSVASAFTLDGISKDALNFSIQNTISEADAVFQSVSKNEHLKK